MARITFFLVSLLALFSISTVHAAVVGKYAVKPFMRSELNQLIQAGLALHSSLVSKQTRQDLALLALLRQTDRAESIAHMLPVKEKIHLQRMLGALKTHLETLRHLRDDDRTQSLSEIFRVLVNINRYYQLDKRFVIMFCQFDQVSWVQDVAGKPRNPIHPDKYPTCGVKVK